jgi:hypothetical protein
LALERFHVVSAIAAVDKFHNCAAKLIA